MLNIIFKSEGVKVVNQPSQTFNGIYYDEWLEDNLVKDIIKDVDKTQVITSTVLMSSVLGPITPIDLSTGTKGLILMLKEDELLNSYWFLSSRYGNNCYKWILHISTLLDVNLIVNSYFNIPKDLFASDKYVVNFPEYNYKTEDMKDAFSKIAEWGWGMP